MLKTQAEMIECRMAMLLIEVGQLCSRMDKNISVLKKMQENPTQHQTEQQSKDLVTSISTVVCSRLEQEFERKSQQQEQQICELSKLVCDALKVEMPEALIKPSLKVSKQQENTRRTRSATESPGKPGSPLARAALRTNLDEGLDSMLRSLSSVSSGREPSTMRPPPPRSQSLNLSPVGSLNMAAVDNTALKDGGAICDLSPKVRSGPGSARSNGDYVVSSASVSPSPPPLSCRPRDSIEAKTLAQTARSARGGRVSVIAPVQGIDQRRTLPATRWSACTSRIPFVRSNSADWSAGPKAGLSSTPLPSHGPPAFRCVGGESMAPCQGNIPSDGLSNGVAESGGSSPHRSLQLPVQS